MDLPSGNSSGSTRIQNSGSEEELFDLRKRKRMESNRESARRSRMRKQKHLGDLTAQINQLKNENSHVITTIKLTKQKFLQIEAENCVLRAQMSELSQSLESLNEIINYISNCTSLQSTNGTSGMMLEFGDQADDYFNQPWNLIMACGATDVLQY